MRFAGEEPCETDDVSLSMPGDTPTVHDPARKIAPPSPRSGSAPRATAGSRLRRIVDARAGDDTDVTLAASQEVEGCFRKQSYAAVVCSSSDSNTMSARTRPAKSSPLRAEFTACSVARLYSSSPVSAREPEVIVRHPGQSGRRFYSARQCIVENIKGFLMHSGCLVGYIRYRKILVPVRRGRIAVPRGD